MRSEGRGDVHASTRGWRINYRIIDLSTCGNNSCMRTTFDAKKYFECTLPALINVLTRQTILGEKNLLRAPSGSTT